MSAKPAPWLTSRRSLRRTLIYSAKGRPIPKRRDKRNNIHDYKHELAGVDEEMLIYLDAAWGSLHWGGYHEGVVVAKMIQAGMECADCLINAIRPATEEARVATV